MYGVFCRSLASPEAYPQLGKAVKLESPVARLCKWQVYLNILNVVICAVAHALDSLVHIGIRARPE